MRLHRLSMGLRGTRASVRRTTPNGASGSNGRQPATAARSRTSAGVRRRARRNARTPHQRGGPAGAAREAAPSATRPIQSIGSSPTDGSAPRQGLRTQRAATAQRAKRLEGFKRAAEEVRPAPGGQCGNATRDGEAVHHDLQEGRQVHLNNLKAAFRSTGLHTEPLELRLCGGDGRVTLLCAGPEPVNTGLGFLDLRAQRLHAGRARAELTNTSFQDGMSGRARTTSAGRG